MIEAITTIIIFLIGYYLGNRAKPDRLKFIDDGIEKVKDKVEAKRFKVFDTDEYEIEQEEKKQEEAERRKREEEMFK